MSYWRWAETDEEVQWGAYVKCKLIYSRNPQYTVQYKSTTPVANILRAHVVTNLQKDECCQAMNDPTLP